MKFEHTVIELHRSNVANIELWDNGIVYMHLEDNTQIELSDVKFQFEFLKSKYNGSDTHLILVETSRYSTISNEAREFSTKPENNIYTKAIAVVVKSLAHRIIINFMINFMKQQSMKMRMFETKEKALEWLLSLRTQNKI